MKDIKGLEYLKYEGGMMIEKKCLICGNTFYVPQYRANAKYCGVNCQRESLRAKPNVKCTYCGKEFHMKKYQKEKTNRNMGYFCSKKCMNEYKKVWFVGENNHQYGLRGDKNATFKEGDIYHKNGNLQETMVYAPYRKDANKNGRITLHRFLVEENWERYRPDAFVVIDGQHILRKGFQVHHIDGNHNNNSLDNLMVVTRSEHSKIHNANYRMVRNETTGRFVARIPISVAIELEKQV